jgi:hypothetical protein
VFVRQGALHGGRAERRGKHVFVVDSEAVAVSPVRDSKCERPGGMIQELHTDHSFARSV